MQKYLDLKNISVISLIVINSIITSLHFFKLLSLPNYVPSTLSFITVTLLTQYAFSNFIKPSKLLVCIPLVFTLPHLVYTSVIIIIENLSNASLQTATLLTYTTLSIILFSIGFFMTIKKESKKNIKRKKAKSDWKVFYFLFLGIIVSRVIFFQDVNLLSTLSPDNIIHNVIIKEIFVNQKYSLNIVSLNPSITIQSYLPIFHLIFGPTIASGGMINSIISYSILETFFFLLSTFWIFFTIRKISRNNFVPVFASLLHMFMFERISAYTSFFLLPQTVAGVWAFIIISRVIHKKRLEIITILNLVVCIFTHFYIGPMSSLLVVIILLLGSIKWLPALIPKFTFIFIFLLFLTYIFEITSGFDLSFLYEYLFSDYDTRKSEFLFTNAASLMNSILLSAGAISIPILLSSLSTIFSKNKMLPTLSTILFLVICLIGFNFPYGTKLFVIYHYLLILIVAFGWKKISLSAKTFLYLATLTIILIGLSTNLVVSSWEYKKTLFNQKQVEYVTNIETDSAKYIFSNYNDSKYIVISNPITMTVTESLTLTTSPGGIFATAESRIQIWKFLNGDISSGEFKHFILERFPSKEILVIYNPRTEQWAARDEEYIKGFSNLIWKPYYKTTKSCENMQFEYKELLYVRENACMFLI